MLLFSTMSWGINCLTDWSNQTWDHLKEQILRFLFEICFNPRKPLPRYMSLILPLKVANLRFSLCFHWSCLSPPNCLFFITTTTSESILHFELLYILLQIMSVLVERCGALSSSSEAEVGTIGHFSLNL